MDSESGLPVFVQLPFSHSCENGRRRICCINIRPASWEPTVKGLKNVVFCDYPTVPLDDFYVIHDGRVVPDDCQLQVNHQYDIRCRVLGGKGGFGSLLRSFGSQISKNRNQDACRDLSGRRLRNVKTEKRMKEYVEKQAEKELEKQKKKEEKLKKMKTTLESRPKHNFNDPEYEAERKRIPDKVFSAVAEGLRVVASTSTALTGSTVATTVSSKVTETFDGSKEKISEQVTATSVPLPLATRAEKKRKHEDPMVNNMKSKRMKGWLGVEDDSSGSDDGNRT